VCFCVWFFFGLGARGGGGSVIGGARARAPPPPPPPNFFTTNTVDAIKAIPYFVAQNHCDRVFVNGEEFLLK
jgi:hypothetical protein